VRQVIKWWEYLVWEISEKDRGKAVRDKAKQDNLEKKSLFGTETGSLEIHEGKRNYLHNRLKSKWEKLL
jgi:hypothetical protein